MIARLSLTLVIALIVGCADGSAPTTASGTLTPTCSPVGDGTLSTFNSDGSFRVTSKGVLQNGALAVNICDGAVERVVFVEGLQIGTARDHQEGVFTDATRHVVYAEDLITTSTEGVTPKGLEGVKVTCSPIGGCDASPTPDKPAEVPIPAAEPVAPAADPATSDATPAPTSADAKVAAGS